MTTLKGGRIRKIAYGQSGKQNQVAYTAGAGKDGLSITEDEDYFILYGKRRFLVWRINKDGEAYIWKELIDMQVEVEYDEEMK